MSGADPTAPSGQLPLMARVAAQVRQRVPVDGREVRSRHRALVALGRLENPLDRHADPTHVTGSAVVTGPEGVLLLLHKKLGIWVQPGGHIDAGESPWEAARREAEEETGLRFAPWPGDPPLAHLDVHPGGAGHVHLDLRYRLVPAGDRTPRPPSGESQEVHWFDWPAALNVSDPGLRGLLRSIAPRP